LLSGNSYYWAFDPDPAVVIDGWSLGGDAISEGAGGQNWVSNQTSPFTLAVTADAVPEPNAFGLAALGLMALAARICRMGERRA
jgi:hypothetical protein